MIDSESETNFDATGDSPATPTGDQEARLLGCDNRISAPPATDTLRELCRSLNTLIADVTAIKAGIDNIKFGVGRGGGEQSCTVARGSGYQQTRPKPQQAEDRCTAANSIRQ